MLQWAISTSRFFTNMKNKIKLHILPYSSAGDRLPVRCAHPPAAAGTRPGDHGRTCVALLPQGGAVLRGDRGVPLRPSPGDHPFHGQRPGDGPLPLRSAGGPGWPGGGRPAPHLRYQHQSADGTREAVTAGRTRCHPGGCDGEFAVGPHCWTWTSLRFFWSDCGCLDLRTSECCQRDPAEIIRVSWTVDYRASAALIFIPEEFLSSFVSPLRKAWCLRSFMTLSHLFVIS